MPSGVDCEESGFPTSTVNAPPGRANGPASNPPATSGAAGLVVVSVWYLPQSHFVVGAASVGGGPASALSVSQAVTSAVASCVKQSTVVTVPLIVAPEPVKARLLQYSVPAGVGEPPPASEAPSSWSM